METLLIYDNYILAFGIILVTIAVLSSSPCMKLYMKIKNIVFTNK